MLQIRGVSDDIDALVELRNKICSLFFKNKKECDLGLKIPIGEPVIQQIASGLNVNYKFFPAISNIDFQDKKLNDILERYVQKNGIGLIKEIKIGPMAVDENSDHVFNGRIPAWTKIVKIKNKKAHIKILNYGGSNVGGGTHIAFLGNDLKTIKFHIDKIFKKLHHVFPDAKITEHKASVIRGRQILYMEGMKGILLRKKIRKTLDPNQIIFTTAMQEIDTFKV
jgi:hypothetical protein